MAEYALRLENSTDTAQRVRAADALGLTPNGPLTARSGVRPGGGAVTVLAGTMQVQVAAFTAWVDGGASDLQGGYVFVADAAKTLTLTDGHASLARTDTVAAVVREDAYDGSGLTVAELVVVEGTPGAGAPTLPTSAVPLRDVSVPAGLSTGTGGLSSGNLGADRRNNLAGLGGVLPVASATERDALASKYAGLAVFREDSGKLEVYDGTDWDTYARAGDLPASGSQNVSISAASSFGSATITFPAGRFSSAPTVVATVTNPPFAAIHAVSISAVTASGCTVHVRHTDNTTGTAMTVGVAWAAFD